MVQVRSVDTNDNKAYAPEGSADPELVVTNGKVAKFESAFDAEVCRVNV
jgi:hypothetical protein